MTASNGEGLMTRIFAVIVAAIVITAAAMQTFGCAETGSARSRAADDVYVPPGEHDKYYAFLSGGQSDELATAHLAAMQPGAGRAQSVRTRVTASR